MDVYKVKFEDGSAAFIPSLEYINCMAKLLSNGIHEVSKNGNYTGLEKIKYTPVDLPIGLTEIGIIDPSSIQTDAEHRFMSDRLINIMKDKPTSYEVDNKLNKQKEDIIVELNNILARLINSKDSMEKIRTLGEILQEEPKLDNLINIINTKLDVEDLDEHKESIYHLTNNDRKALNEIIRILSNGIADWNAEPSDPNYIKNKPTSMIANGGNADTISGCRIDEIRNKRLEDLVLSGTEKDKDKCDYITNKLPINNHYKYNRILLRESSYKANEISYDLIGSGIVIIEPEDYNINISSSYVENITFIISDISIINGFIKRVIFNKCKIHIFSNTTIEDCEFKDCEIYLNNGVSNIIIKYSEFNNTKMQSLGLMDRCIIKDNIGLNFKYYTGNNLVKDNI